MRQYETPYKRHTGVSHGSHVPVDGDRHPDTGALLVGARLGLALARDGEAAQT